MKAHLPAVHIAPKPTKNQIKLMHENYEVNEIRRFMKLVCYSLSLPLSPKGHGMGAGQINKVIRNVSELADSRKNDPIFWQHLDERLIEQMGIKFERENYDEMGE